jgi:AraC-like DNA-binding protein
VDSPEFAEFAPILKRLTGLSMALNTPCVEKTRIGVKGDEGNPLCRIIRGTREGHRRCEGCDRRHHALAVAEGHARLYTCHAGFLDMAIPIMIQGEHVATISSGQVLTEQHSDAGFARTLRRLRWLNVPEARLRAAYKRAPWIPRDRLTHVMRLLELFARELCNSAWRIRELEAQLERPSIRRGKAIIDERFSDPELSLADVAAHAGVSRAHFSHLFHKETGVTFTRHVQSRRVEEARHLLAETGKTITEICFQCGFNSLTHFNRVFRRGCDCSPSQYRQRVAPIASSVATGTSSI